MTARTPATADIAGALDYAFRRLTTDLDPRYVYHDQFHTFQHVMPAAEYLAQVIGLEKGERDLLRIGVAFHDIGFVEGRDKHEQRSSAIAAEVLPRFDFSPDATSVIISLIAATCLPQHPQNLLEEIIADADLDVLGRDDFLARNALLYRETVTFNGAISPEVWRRAQLRFLEHHRYFTQAARDRRDAGKRTNLALLSQPPN